MDSRSSRRYPIFLDPIDRTGKVKACTLEFFVRNAGPHKAKELYADTDLTPPLMKGGRSVEIRLLKYCRAGLLRRTRERRAYQYSITTEGETRLMHLWERLGYLNPNPTGSEDEREVVKQRIRICISLVDKQLKKFEDQ